VLPVVKPLREQKQRGLLAGGAWELDQRQRKRRVTMRGRRGRRDWQKQVVPTSGLKVREHV
jgi:hypothetical protein